MTTAGSEAVKRPREYLEVQGLHHLIVPIGENEADHRIDRRISGVIEDDAAALLEHLVDEKEIDESVIERVPAVDERESETFPAPNEGVNRHRAEE